MLSALFALLVGVVLKLDNFVEVVGAGLLSDVLLDEIAEFELVDLEGVVGVEEGPAGGVSGYQGILPSRPSEMSVVASEVGLLRHPHFLDVLHPLHVLLPHQHHSLVCFF